MLPADRKYRDVATQILQSHGRDVLLAICTDFVRVLSEELFLADEQARDAWDALNQLRQRSTNQAKGKYHAA